MANVFLNIPTAVGNGVGAPVDVSSMGAFKSIVCAGDAEVAINVEINNAQVNTDGGWQSIATFQGDGNININVAARWMRVRSSGFMPAIGGTTQVDVGSTNDGTTFALLPVPAGTGVGAAVDVSALPAFKSVQVGGTFRGTLLVEVSEDGSTAWSQPFSFQTPGVVSLAMMAQFMRVRRVGVPDVQPGTPVVNVGAAGGASGAGGGVATDQITVLGDGTSGDLIRAGALIPRFVFRPGGVAGDGVYTTWATLYADLVQVTSRGMVYLEFDDRLSSPCTIPVGTWDMTNVVWTNTVENPPIQPVTLVDLADGASIVLTAPVAALRIEGYGLQIRCDRVGPVAPFVGVNLVLDGFGVRLFNTSALALPMWEGTGANALLITGSCARAQIGNGQGSPPVPAPLIDVAGGVLGISAAAGLLFDNALTDTVGGGFIFTRAFDDAFNGGGGADTTYTFPDLVAGGGVFDGSAVEHRDRFLVDPTLAVETWESFINEFVRGDTTTDPLTVTAPPASCPGDRFAVKDFTGNAAVNAITIVPQGTDTVEAGTITTNSQTKIWVSDGQGTWMLASST